MKNITQFVPRNTQRLDRRINCRFRSEAGQALLEVALVAPVFFLLLIGAAEFGLLEYNAIGASNAARAAVAYGAQSHISASDGAGMQAAAANDGSNLSGLSATANNFCACSNAPTTQVACSAAVTLCSPAPTHPIEYVQVITTATVNPPFHLPGLPATFTLHGQATMRVQQ